MFVSTDSLDFDATEDGVGFETMAQNRHLREGLAKLKGPRTISCPDRISIKEVHEKVEKRLENGPVVSFASLFSEPTLSFVRDVTVFRLLTEEERLQTAAREIMRAHLSDESDSLCIKVELFIEQISQGNVAKSLDFMSDDIVLTTEGNETVVKGKEEISERWKANLSWMTDATWVIQEIFVVDESTACCRYRVELNQELLSKVRKLKSAIPLPETLTFHFADTMHFNNKGKICRYLRVLQKDGAPNELISLNVGETSDTLDDKYSEWKMPSRIASASFTKKKTTSMTTLVGEEGEGEQENNEKITASLQTAESSVKVRQMQHRLTQDMHFKNMQILFGEEKGSKSIEHKQSVEDDKKALSKAYTRYNLMAAEGEGEGEDDEYGDEWKAKANGVEAISESNNPEITESIANMKNLVIDENYFVQEGALDGVMKKTRSFGSQADESAIIDSPLPTPDASNRRIRKSQVSASSEPLVKSEDKVSDPSPILSHMRLKERRPTGLVVRRFSAVYAKNPKSLLHFSGVPEMAAKIKEKMGRNEVRSTLFDEMQTLLLSIVRKRTMGHFVASPYYKRFLQIKILESISLNSGDFQVMRDLGKGAFGMVSACRSKLTDSVYAMKTLGKHAILTSGSVSPTHVMNELKLLKKLNNPFIVGLNYAFQDSASLYFVIDLCLGGDLKYILTREGNTFPKHKSGYGLHISCAMFYCAEIALGLDYMHRKHVIHRDIKPSNIMLDISGHVKITDFGLAKPLASYNDTPHRGCAGTPGYMCHEVMSKRPYGRGADWFSLGVMLYEMIDGRNPFYGTMRKYRIDENLGKIKQGERASTLYSMLMATPIHFTRKFEKYPHVRGLILALTTKKANLRACSQLRGGFKRFQKQPCFKHLHWDKLLTLSEKPPYIPKNIFNTEQHHFDKSKKPQAMSDQGAPGTEFEYVWNSALSNASVLLTSLSGLRNRNSGVQNATISLSSSRMEVSVINASHTLEGRCSIPARVFDEYIFNNPSEDINNNNDQTNRKNRNCRTVSFRLNLVTLLNCLQIFAGRNQKKMKKKKKNTYTNNNSNQTQTTSTGYYPEYNNHDNVNVNNPSQNQNSGALSQTNPTQTRQLLRGNTIMMAYELQENLFTVLLCQGDIAVTECHFRALEDADSIMVSNENRDPSSQRTKSISQISKLKRSNYDDEEELSTNNNDSSDDSDDPDSQIQAILQVAQRKKRRSKLGDETVSKRKLKRRRMRRLSSSQDGETDEGNENDLIIDDVSANFFQIFRKYPVCATFILKSNMLRDVLSELLVLPGANAIEIGLSEKSIYFSCIGQNRRCFFSVPHTSEAFHLYDCRSLLRKDTPSNDAKEKKGRSSSSGYDENDYGSDHSKKPDSPPQQQRERRFRYTLRTLESSVRCLSQRDRASNTKMAFLDNGMLKFQHILIHEAEKKTFVEYICLPIEESE
eukprot:g1936.t1